MKSTTTTLCLLGLVLTFAPPASQAQPTPNPPGQISYQGFLTDANGFPLATNNAVNYNIQFRIWNASTGGSNLWGELQVVTVDRGYFTVMLGNGSSLPAVPFTNNLAGIFSGSDASDRYLEMTVQGLAPGDPPIQPRLRLLASPYSYLASKALNALNVSDSNVALRSGGNTFTGNQTNTGGSIYMDNSAEIFAKNTSGTYEQVFYPRWADNATYLDYGSGGFHIRNDSYQETMFMATNGDVGIGTVSPATLLHIADSTYPTLRVDSSSTAGTWLALGNSSAGGRYWQLISSGSGNGGGAGKLIIAAGSSAGGTDANPMVIQDNGNVGIGTLTPGTRLEISAPNVADGVDLYGAGPAYFLSDANKNQEAALGVAASSGQYSTDAATGDVVLRNSGSGNLFLQNGEGASGLALNNNNVGIGTPSPAAKLDVNGNIAMGNGEIFQARNNANGLENFLWPRWTDNVTYLNYGSAGFNIRNNSSTTTMFMDNSGKVGIGTASPVVQFDVEHVTNKNNQYEYIFQFNAGGNGVLHSRTFVAGGPYNLELFQGNAFKPGGGSWGVVSDARLKKDVRNLDGALDSLLRLRSVTFEYKDPASVHQPPGRHNGFIAQEVEKVFPEWVGLTANGMKSVAPVGFESLTVQALRELRAEKDAQIQDLRRQNEALEKRLQELEARDRERGDRLAAIERLVRGRTQQAALQVPNAPNGN